MHNILKEYINQHIVLTAKVEGIKLFIDVDNVGNMTYRNNNGNPLNEVDKTLYKQYNDIDVTLFLDGVYNSTLCLKCTTETTYLISVKKNGVYYSMPCDLKTFSKHILGIVVPTVLFEGKYTGQSIESINGLTELMVLIDNKTRMISGQLKTNDDDTQLTNMQVVTVCSELTTLPTSEYTNQHERYIDLIGKLFLMIHHLIVDKNIKNQFNFELSLHRIHDIHLLTLLEDVENRRLFRLLLALFWKNRGWYGYFYRQPYSANFKQVFNTINQGILNNN